MELYAKGQLSYLILTCLQDRDFYGLDIISEIAARSNGKINLKKPSVYSNLTRMEKQGYISSYLQNSDYGPNRKYYSLTEKGRGFYQELKAYFDFNKIDVFRDFVDEDVIKNNFLEIKQEEPAPLKEVAMEDKVETEENDYFDFSSLDENTISKVNSSSPSYSGEQVEVREEIVNVEETIVEPEVKEVEVKDDAVFLPSNASNDTNEYNQRIFDISKDINKIKRKRSFAEDQISMTATDPLEISNEKKKANIEEFKSSLLENKTRYTAQPVNSAYERNRYNNFNFKPEEKKEAKKEEVKDDAVLITGHLTENDIAKAKKIEPPKIKIVSENTKDTRLPAPKRDTTVDPSHREILNKLYSRTKDGATAEVRADAIYDYNDLKEFYEEQNISFSIYQKSVEKRNHNTNLLYLFISLGSLLMTALCSTLLYVILLKTNMINPNTTFLYILLPALLIFDVCLKAYNYKVYSSWMPNKLSPQWTIWCYFFLAVCIVVGLNLIFGLAVKEFSLFATTLLLPIILAFLLIPVRYYAKQIVLVKYWH